MPSTPAEPLSPSRHVGGAVPAVDDSDLLQLDGVASAALRWSVRRMDGLDAAQEAAFQRWLAADARHRQEFEALQDVWASIDALPAGDVHRFRREAQAIAPVGRPQPAPRPRPAAEKPPRRAWLQIAWPRFGLPQALAAGVLAGVLWGGHAWYQQPVFSKSYATARGQTMAATLPDGSVITLDTGSRAEVALYRGRREVRLPDGEVMFEVHPDAGRPFDVLAGPMRITVVGTRFSVRYTPALQQGHVQVAVEEGHVRVAPAQDVPGAGTPPQAVELHAGDAVVADAQGQLGAVTHGAAARAAPWRERRISFEDTPLGEVLQELERYGDTGLSITDPAVASMRMNGSVDLLRLADFRATLPLVLPVRLVSRGATTEIVASRR
ncbi:MAG: FecR domain-containing protein [Pseudorhodoferax sp.]